MPSIKNKRVILSSTSDSTMDDISSLSLLYGPLIGSDAISIYLSFISLNRKGKLNSETFLHKDLFDMLALSEAKFLSSRYKLEAIDLIQTYESDDSLAYVIHKPQTASQFIKNGVLGIYLNSQIGPDNFKRILPIFTEQKPEISNFKNITKRFEDVFNLTNETKINVGDIDLTDNTYARSIELNNGNLSIDEFMKSIDIHYIEPSQMESFKKNVLSLSSAYQLTLTDMICAYNQSIDSSDSFNLKMFKTKVRKIYNVEHGNVKPVLTNKVEDINNELYEEFLNLKADEIFTLADIKNDAQNRATLATIYNGISFDKAIINMMVISVCKKLHELPKLSYFEQMYNTMSEQGINTPSLAKAYLFDHVKFEKPKSNYRTFKKTNNIDSSWAKDSASKILKEWGADDE